MNLFLKHKSTFLHLRIPFALYLVPVFTFAVSQSQDIHLKNIVISFIAIHFFLYPAANGYNSYFDNDKGSIGGLKNPPQIKSDLYFASLCFDAISIILALILSWQFALMLFIYGLESKAYSHPSIRLKKYAYTAAIVTSLFQGGFAYIMAYIALNQVEFSGIFESKVLYPFILCSTSFLGFYPITQVYQHKQDMENKEKTISIKLGLHGTFLFCGIVFFLTIFGYYIYFTKILYSFKLFLVFQIFLLPLTVYFIWWYRQILIDLRSANYRNTMLFNKIAAFSISAFFVLWSLIK